MWRRNDTDEFEFDNPTSRNRDLEYVVCGKQNLARAITSQCFGFPKIMEEVNDDTVLIQAFVCFVAKKTISRLDAGFSNRKKPIIIGELPIKSYKISVCTPKNQTLIHENVWTLNFGRFWIIKWEILELCGPFCWSYFYEICWKYVGDSR